MLRIDFNLVLTIINLIVLYLILRKIPVSPGHGHYGKAGKDDCRRNQPRE